MTPCIFCAIINKTIPATIIWESDNILVIEDKFPKASIHWLIIPKVHIPDIREISPFHTALAPALFDAAHTISKLKPETASFRLIANTGEAAGQTIFHAHIHFLAGQKIPGF